MHRACVVFIPRDGGQVFVGYIECCAEIVPFPNAPG